MQKENQSPMKIDMQENGNVRFAKVPNAAAILESISQFATAGKEPAWPPEPYNKNGCNHKCNHNGQDDPQEQDKEIHPRKRQRKHDIEVKSKG